MEKFDCYKDGEITSFFIEEDYNYDAWQEVRHQDWTQRESVPAVWIALHRTNPPGPSDDSYTALFIKISADTLLSFTLLAPERFYLGKGCTPAVFARVAEETKRKIVSSSNKRSKKFYPNESRNCNAERVWRALLTNDRATYDPEEDRYTFRLQDESVPPS